MYVNCIFLYMSFKARRELTPGMLLDVAISAVTELVQEQFQ